MQLLRLVVAEGIGPSSGKAKVLCRLLHRQVAPGARPRRPRPLNASNGELGLLPRPRRAPRRTARTARVDALLAAALERQAHPESYEHESGEPVERSFHAGASAVSKAARRPCVSAFLVTSAMSTPGVMITIAATARNGRAARSDDRRCGLIGARRLRRLLFDPEERLRAKHARYCRIDAVTIDDRRRSTRMRRHLTLVEAEWIARAASSSSTRRPHGRC